MPASTPCAHCGQPVPADRLGGEGPVYCCHGCAAAAALLAGMGLDHFYQLRDAGEVMRPDARQPPPEIDETLAAYDAAAFAEQYVEVDADGRERVCWAVSGLHCAACVWMLEHLPQAVDGLERVRVNMAEDSLETVHEPGALGRGALAGLVGRLGYRLRPWGDPRIAAEKRRERRTWYLRLAIAAASAMGTMHLSLSLFAGHATGDMASAEVQFFGLIAVIVALPALTWCAGPFYRGALAGVLTGRFTIDASVVVVLLIGSAASLVNLAIASPELYVDALAMFVALLLVGRVVLMAVREAVQRQSGREVDLLPLTAERRRPDGANDTVAVADLLPGEVIVISAGSVLPCDGTVVDAAMRCDTAILTGEARPVTVDPGGAVHAGCRAVADGALAVTAVGSETRLGGLLAAVRRGRQERSRRTDLLDRVQAGFAPVVVALAAVTGLLWWWWDPSRAWDQAIAVVLVACPCALGLAAPVAYSLAGHRAVRQRIFLRDGACVEDLAAPDHVVFDKTGTLTTGVMQVVSTTWSIDDTLKEQVLAALAIIETRSAHPIAQAVEAWCRAQDSKTEVAVQDIEEVTGAGCRADTSCGKLRIGSAAFVGHVLVAQPTSLTATVVGVVLDDVLVGELVIDDPLRPDIAQVIAAFPEAQCHVLSGDRPETVERVAEHLGISHWQAGCSPEDKRTEVERLSADGVTVMFGDGVNDCLALQAADVGIAVRGGLEAAVAASTVYLPEVTSGRLLELISGARATVRVLRRTLLWAVVYNLIAVGLVVGGLWGPYVCAVAMPVSSLAVVLMLILGRFFHAPQAGR